MNAPTTFAAGPGVLADLQRAMRDNRVDPVTILQASFDHILAAEDRVQGF